MRLKRYIVWSKNKIDMTDKWQKKWYIQQVLTYGRAEDIAELNWEEIRLFLDEITLPLNVKRLWQDYLSTHLRM